MARKRRPDGFFSGMSDDELINFVKNNQFGKNLSGVQKSDSSLYSVIRKRNLIDRLCEEGVLIRILRKRGVFSDLSERQIIDYAVENHSGKKISQIEDEDPTFCHHIRSSNLTDLLVEKEIIRRGKRKNNLFGSISNSELIMQVRDEFMGLSITQLQKGDLSLYREVHKRNLMDPLVEQGILIRNSKIKGYWHVWGNFERELTGFINELGRFPYREDFIEAQKSSLGSAFSLHGGVNVIRERMGYEPSKKPCSYWKEWDNLTSNLESIIEEIDHFPTSGELKELGRYDIINAFHYHGGINKVRERMGYYKSETRTGHWTDWSIVEAEFSRVIEQLGHFPTQRELKDLELGKLINAASHHGNFTGVREKMGYPAERNNIPIWESLDSWREYGLECNFNERNPSSLSKSSDSMERSWYGKGISMKWLSEFEFNKKRVNYPWQTEEEWRHYGLEQGFDERSPSSLARSKDRTKRSWYNKGRISGWGNDFEFKRKTVHCRWGSQDEWHECGKDKGYNLKSETDLRNSENIDERRWFNKGYSEGWIRGSLLGNKFIRNRWKTKEEWIEYGVNNGYCEINPTSLQKSENKDESAWYRKGNTSKWLRDFDFARKRADFLWNSKDEWVTYGLENGFNEKIRVSLLRSSDKVIRAWYKKGSRNGWIKNFEFINNKSGIIDSSKQLIDFLHDDKKAANLAATATALPGQEYELESILYEMYQDRFRDEKQVHELIEANRGEVYKLAKEGYINLGGYIGDFSLEDRGIIPVLVGETLSEISWDGLAASQQDVFFNALMSYYGPEFNRDPKSIFLDLEERMTQYTGDAGSVFGRVRDYYQRVIDTMEELGEYGKID
jgi:hypothetical protein